MVASSEPANAKHIFISYASEVRPLVRELGALLEGQGYEVWWDKRGLLPGDAYPAEIQDALNAARAVIVIWSARARESAWVLKEARSGFDRRCLIPASLDGKRGPAPFSGLEEADLSSWYADPAHPSFQLILLKLESLLGKTPQIVRPAPKVDPKRYSVVVGGIDNDIDRQLQTLFTENLSEFRGVHVVRLDRPILHDTGNPEADERAAQAAAKRWLKEMDATIMVWGRVLRVQNKLVPKIYLTVAQEEERDPGRYVPDDSLRLPSIFWSELADLLRLVVSTFAAEFHQREGVFLGDELVPFVGRVRDLLARTNEDRGWPPAMRGEVRIMLGNALMLIGNQSGEREPLVDASTQFRLAIKEVSDAEDGASRTARAQNGLALCLWMQGERNADIAHLKESVRHCRAALDIWLSEPDARALELGQSYNDLGNVLLAWGLWSFGDQLIEEAISSYRNALETRTRITRARDWAQTRANLGVAYWKLGQRRRDPAFLDEARSALESALTVYSPEAYALDWAQTMNNLGLVHCSQGILEDCVTEIRTSLKIFDEAQRQRKREQTPLLWGQTRNNVGLAELSLGRMTQSQHHLDRAVAALHDAMTERTYDRSPAEWAETQANLAAALWARGLQENDRADLEASVNAARAALEFFSASEQPTPRGLEAESNLGNVLASLGVLAGDHGTLAKACKHLREVVDIEAQFGSEAAHADGLTDLVYATFHAGMTGEDSCLFSEAADASAAAGAIWERLGDPAKSENLRQQSTAILDQARKNGM